MLTLDPELIQHEPTVLIEEEPALEIALPQVFEQPVLGAVQRGRLLHLEALVARLYQGYQQAPEHGLGSDYQLLVGEFQPLFDWAIASWDYLLSTEGCRFVPRAGEHKAGARGDYRAVTDKDFSRLIHAMFRRAVLDFAQAPDAPSLGQYLRRHFWPMTLDAYRRLDQPADPRQRTLTPYSYLRCVPYQFLNEYHQDLVYGVVERLPAREQSAVNAYFLHFFTEPATAEALVCPAEEVQSLLRGALVKLLVSNRLVYCLLRQIERY